MSNSYHKITPLYEGKSQYYFGVLRSDLVQLIAQGDNKLLEIGCSTGVTGEELKKTGKATEVVGIELTSASAAQAETRLDKVICGDIEQIEIPYPQDYFDCVLCGDVLEHLRDPWAVVKNLKKHIKQGGIIVASIPNVRNWRIIRDLALHGRWEYVSSGILDETHLRFFTKTSIINLFTGAGFEIDLLTHNQFGRIANLVDLLSFHVAEDFLVKQYYLRARKGI